MTDAAKITPSLTQERPTGQAMLRGARGRCPACGEGRLFTSYLKVADACPACHEDLHHQRADDGPAYLTILIVGHLLAPIIYWFYVEFRPEPLVMATIFCLATGSLALFLLPRMKGALVALQWAKRMHGFAREIDPAHGDA